MTTDVVSYVRRCRVRLRLLAFLHAAVGLVGLAMAVATAWIVFGRDAGAPAWAVFAGCTAAALAGAALVAWNTAPTLTRTAGLIDERLRLQDRTAAAIQLAAHTDPVSRLVVRDAARRLQAVAPAEMFRLRLGWQAAVAASATATALLAAAMNLTWAPGASAPVGAGAATSGMGSALSSRSQEPPASLAAAVAGKAAPSPNADSSSQPVQPRPSGLAPEGTSPAGPNASLNDDRPPVAAPPGVNGATPAASIPPEAGDAPPSDRTAGRTAGDEAPSADRVSRSAAGGASPGESATGAGGTDTAGAFGGLQSGGVSGSPGRTSVATSTKAAPRFEGGSRPGGAIGREGVVLRDDVPPARREYVRDYFQRVLRGGAPR